MTNDFSSAPWGTAKGRVPLGAGNQTEKSLKIQQFIQALSFPLPPGVSRQPFCVFVAFSRWPPYCRAAANGCGNRFSQAWVLVPT